jgi:hypothetical protein
MSDVTQILDRVQQSDPTAAAELLPLVYDELRALAAAPPKLSPTENLLAYVSRETGQSEVSVASFRGFQGKKLLSHGGREPLLWRRDGSELFLFSPDGRTRMSVMIHRQGVVEASDPKKVFDPPEFVSGGAIDIAPDGNRFLMVQLAPEERGIQTRLRPSALVIENWFEEIRQRQCSAPRSLIAALTPSWAKLGWARCIAPEIPSRAARSRP